jgi:hypothetical protein
LFGDRYEFEVAGVLSPRDETDDSKIDVGVPAGSLGVLADEVLAVVSISKVSA